MSLFPLFPYQTTVRVDVEEIDRYGREVGRVWRNGKSINLAMIAESWAWHFKQYSDTQAVN